MIPFQVSGSFDMDSSTANADEVTMWGLMNLWQQNQEGPYLVKHGEPVNDFPNPDCPNFFERAFPCLFPWGEGGFERRRSTPISFRGHVRWALQYFDRRFRKHETFPFVAFGILQKRETLTAARLQMRKKQFDRDARLISTLTLERFEDARRRELLRKVQPEHYFERC